MLGNSIPMQIKKAKNRSTRWLRPWLVGLVILVGLFQIAANECAANANQNGQFTGRLEVTNGTTMGGEWWCDTVYIPKDCTLEVPYQNDNAQNPSSRGRLILHANTIWIEGTINAAGRGYQASDGSKGQEMGYLGDGGESKPAGYGQGSPGTSGANAVLGSDGNGNHKGTAGFGAAGGNGIDGGGGSGGPGGSGGGGKCGDGGSGSLQNASDASIDPNSVEVEIGSSGGSGGGGAGGGGGGGGAGCAYAGCPKKGGHGGNGGRGGQGGHGGAGGGCVQLIANQRLIISGSGKIDTSGISGTSGAYGNDGDEGDGAHSHTGYASGSGGKGGKGGKGSDGGDGAGGGVWLFCPKYNGISQGGQINTLGGSSKGINSGVIQISYQSDDEHNPTNSLLYSNYIKPSTAFMVPKKPCLVTPDDLAVLLPQSTAFGAQYLREQCNGTVHVKISRTQDFSSDDVAYLQSTSVSNNSMGSVSADLQALGFGTFYWMALSVDDKNCSEPSDIRTFEVVYNNPPALVSPVSGASIQSCSADLQATYKANPATSNQGFVHFQVAIDSEFNTIVCQATGQTPVVEGSIVNSLFAGLQLGKYFWRAQNQDQAGIHSVYSEVRQFVVLGPATATPTSTVTPTVTVTSTITPTCTPTATLAIPQTFFKVANSVINPVRGEGALIRWTQPQSGAVSITIYNSLGERVKVLLDKEGQSDGAYHEVIWHGVNGGGRIVGSGIYLVTINTPGYQARSKIAVIK